MHSSMPLKLDPTTNRLHGGSDLHAGQVRMLICNGRLPAGTNLLIPGMDGFRRNPSMSDGTAALLNIYLDRFANRSDAYYQQWVSNDAFGYVAIYQPLTAAVVRQHLIGRVTLSIPAVSNEGM